MTEIQRRKELAEAEKRASHAFEVSNQIIRGIAAIRTAWNLLAAYCYEFHEERYWQVLQFESLEAYLGSPDIGMRRSKFFGLVAMHRELIETRGLKQEDLEGLDFSKVQVVLPAIQSGKVSLEKGLDDARELSRSDLRIEYGGEPEVTDRRPCPTCGTNVDPSKLKAAA